MRKQDTIQITKQNTQDTPKMATHMKINVIQMHHDMLIYTYYRCYFFKSEI